MAARAYPGSEASCALDHRAPASQPRRHGDLSLPQRQQDSHQREAACGDGSGRQGLSARRGLEAWRDAGLPTVKDARQPIEIMRQVQIGAGSLVALGTARASLRILASTCFRERWAWARLRRRDRLLWDGPSAGLRAVEPATGVAGRVDRRNSLMTDLLAGLSGSLVGLILGVVGGGGSILAVPLLIYAVGMASPHAAIGTSAVAVAGSALVNLGAHGRAGNVKWRCGLVFAAAGVAGALAGSTVAKSLDGQKLLSLFGLLMLVVGILMFIKRGQGR